MKLIPLSTAVASATSALNNQTALTTHTPNDRLLQSTNRPSNNNQRNPQFWINNNYGHQNNHFDPSQNLDFFITNDLNKFEICRGQGRYNSWFNPGRIGYASEPAARFEAAEGPDGKIYVVAKDGPGLVAERTVDGNDQQYTLTKLQPWIYGHVDATSGSKALLDVDQDCLLMKQGRFFVTENQGRLYINICHTGLFDPFIHDQDPTVCYASIRPGEIVDLEQSYYSAYKDGDVALLMGGQNSETLTCYSDDRLNDDFRSLAASSASTAANRNGQSNVATNAGSNNGFGTDSLGTDYSPPPPTCDLETQVDGAVGIGFTVPGPNGTVDTYNFVEVIKNLNWYGYDWIPERYITPVRVAFDPATGQKERLSLDEKVERCAELKQIYNNTFANYQGMTKLCDDAEQEQRIGRIIGYTFLGLVGSIAVGLGAYFLCRNCDGPSMRDGCGDACLGTGEAINHGLTRVGDGCRWMTDRTKACGSSLCTKISDGCQTMTATATACLGLDDEAGSSDNASEANPSEIKPETPSEPNISVNVSDLPDTPHITGGEIELEVMVEAET